MDQWSSDTLGKWGAHVRQDDPAGSRDAVGGHEGNAGEAGCSRRPHRPEDRGRCTAHFNRARKR